VPVLQHEDESSESEYPRLELTATEKHAEFARETKTGANYGAAHLDNASQDVAKDADLTRLIEAWPTLSADAKAAILALVDGSHQ
jgi:hypothetical protein